MTESKIGTGLLKKIGGLAAVGVILSGCATQPNLVDENNDPFEGVNRSVFVFNDLIDVWFLKPAATLYRGLMPPPLQEGIHNALSNLSAPVVLLNDLLQGEPDRAVTTLSRFAINSTVGVLGFRDQASKMGYESHSEDFGQTLAKWGVNDGPYLVLPIFGPSSPRDGVGLVVDYFTDPINMWARNTNRDAIPTVRAALGAVDVRARYYDELEDLKKSSVDYYAAVRSLYIQRRNAEILNGAEDPSKAAAPSLSFDFNAPAPGDEIEEITEAR